MTVEKIIDALKSCEAWLTRWGSHVAYCRGYPNCTCGLDAMRAEASIALVGSDSDEAEESDEEWRVAFAIAAADNVEHLGEEMDDVQQQYVKMARAAIAALGDGPPSLSPKLIDELGKLATYLTAQGEYEACDLIDTVVARLTPPPGEKQ